MLNRIRQFFSGKRSYDGAQGGRRWRGTPDMPNQLTATLEARGPLAKRARYLAGNNALAASAATAWVSALVGNGIKPQSTHADTAIRATMNTSFEAWTDVADMEGMTDFYGLQGIMARRMVIDGEAFALLINTDDGLRIRLIDAEQVDASLSRPTDSGRIVQGIEFDAAGRRVAYWITPDQAGQPYASVAPARRVDAADVVHMFRPETPGQVRGISWFAPAMLRMADLDQWRDAQLMRQKTAALMAGFITSMDGGATPLEGEQSGSAVIGGLTPGGLHYLAPGQDYKQSTPALVGAEVIAFAKMVEREIAVALGLPATALTGDLSDTNFSSARVGLIEFRRLVETVQHGVIAFQALRPIWVRWATTEVLSGRIQTTVAAAMPAKFIPPKTMWVDPLKDVQAEVMAIDAGLMSRREAVTARGVDIEVLDAERAADADRAKSLGLAPPPANDNTPPAAIAA